VYTLGNGIPLHGPEYRCDITPPPPPVSKPSPSLVFVLKAFELHSTPAACAKNTPPLQSHSHQFLHMRKEYDTHLPSHLYRSTFSACVKHSTSHSPPSVRAYLAGRVQPPPYPQPPPPPPSDAVADVTFLIHHAPATRVLDKAAWQTTNVTIKDFPVVRAVRTQNIQCSKAQLFNNCALKRKLKSTTVQLLGGQAVVRSLPLSRDSVRAVC